MPSTPIWQFAPQQVTPAELALLTDAATSGTFSVSDFDHPRSRRTANLENTVVHTTLEVDRHEMVHLIALQWGRPVPLLTEGVATWLDGGQT